jgi:hypothetical protein
MPVPDFTPGEVLTAAAMDSIGLWLVKTQTVGTAVPNVVVTGAFSADFDNYRITYTGGTTSATTNIVMVMGATTTGYYAQTIYQQYASALAPLANVPDNNGAAWNYIGGGGAATFARVALDLYNPFLATRTVVSSQYATQTVAGATNGFLNNTTSYTGFTFGCGAGTLTGGTIRVYGYRN